MSDLLTRHQNEHTVIRVRLRTGVWEVSRDGVFFGDYLDRRHAVEAAEVAAASFQAMGGVADIEAEPARRRAQAAGR